MGVIYSSAKRFVMNYNYSNRAMRELSRQEKKIKPPPRHKSAGAARLEEVAKEQDIVESFKKDQSKNDHLLEMLKQVKVDSTGANPDHPNIENYVSTRALPQDKGRDVHSDLWFPDPNIVTKGKYSLRQALDFISKHQAAPDSYSAATIAEEYNLDQKHVENVLSHFSNFKIYNREDLPKDSKKDSGLEPTQ